MDLRRWLWAVALATALLYVVAVVLAIAVWLSLTDKAQEIQASRREAVINTCRDSNERHDNTIRRLDKLIAQMKPGPRKERAKANREQTASLIRALVPKANCEKRADRLVKP